MIDSSNTDSFQHEKRKNRKRKNTVLLNARKYGKQGTFGRGTHISEDTYQYFVQVLELYKAGFSDEEEKLLFANNVFEQIKSEEINYSSNQLGCRVIETLLPLASFEVHERFMKLFSDNLRMYCCHRFCSFVLQALLRIGCEKAEAVEEDSEQEKNASLYQEFRVKVGKFLLNNLEDFISDTNANHIMRTVLQSLTETPTHHDIVKEYGQRLLVWPQFKDLPYSELTSGLLQILLQSIHKIDLKLLKKIQKILLDESYAIVSDSNTDELSLPDVFKSKPAVMLLETSISVAATKSFTQIYAKCFIGKLATLARMKDTNFAVQKLINHCNEKTEFESMFDELSECYEQLLISGYTGVLVSIAQACKRLGAKQGNFIQLITNAFHCNEPQDRQIALVPAILRLVPFERLEAVERQHYFIQLHGSVLLQVMFEFNKPIKLVNSLLDQKTEELKKLACDKKGSYVVEAFLKSQFVGEKSREKLIRKMQGTYQDLAVSSYGSRSLETIWSVSNLKQMTHIMEELAYKTSLWANTQSGKFIATNFNVDLYRRNKDAWKQGTGKKEKTKQLFEDITKNI